MHWEMRLIRKEGWHSEIGEFQIESFKFAKELENPNYSLDFRSYGLSASAFL